jgi:hypothetical protein
MRWAQRTRRTFLCLPKDKVGERVPPGAFEFKAHKKSSPKAAFH